MFPRLTTFLPLLCALGLLAAPALAAKKPEKDFSDKVYAELPKIHKNLEGEKKNLSLALRQVNALLGTKGRTDGIEADSYDEAFLNRLKSQIFLLQSKYTDSIAPLERFLAIAKLWPHFFSTGETLETILFLSQINYQVAAESKRPDIQKRYYANAIRYIQQWLTEAPVPTQRNLIFASSLYYQVATLDAKNLDKDKIRQSLDYGWKSLVADLKPAEQSYQIILACLLQLGDYARAADILETFLAKNPKNGAYWQQLVGIYYALADDAQKAKNPSEFNRLNLLAALTIERAQTHGFMNGNKDNFNLIAIYYSIRQFAKAAELIEDCMARKQLDSDKRIFDLLSSAYHEIHKDDRAIIALKRATEIYTHNGELEFTIAQYSYANDDKKEAYERLHKAVQKGGVSRPGPLRVFLAYVCFELKKFNEALKWIEEAAQLTDTKKNDTDRLRKSIQDALRDEAARKQQQQPQQQPQQPAAAPAA